jgi:ribosomal-protein-alanine N-acetyltransferase
VKRYNASVPLRIREFRRADFLQLWSIDQECFPPGIAYTRVELAHYMVRRGAFTLVAENPEGRRPQIVAFVAAECDQRGLGHVLTIDVLPAARRTGLGSRLLAEAEARIQAGGCRAIYLETAVDNAAAIAFYERHGYSVMRTLPRYYAGRLNAFLMGKRLPKPLTAEDAEGAEEAK